MSFAIIYKLRRYCSNRKEIQMQYELIFMWSLKQWSHREIEYGVVVRGWGWE